MALATTSRRSKIDVVGHSDSRPPAASRTADYAALEAIFGVGMVGLIALTSRRERDGGHPISTEELVLLAMSTFTLTDVLAKERISTWLREPFVEEGSDHKPVRPEGSGMRYAVGELLTCTRCVGAWSAMGLVTLRTASPTAGRATMRVLALAGLNERLVSHRARRLKGAGLARSRRDGKMVMSELTERGRARLALVSAQGGPL